MKKDELIDIIIDFLEENGLNLHTFCNDLKIKYFERNPEKKRKILYSPGYGAGWSSWSGSYQPELKKFMLEYDPFINHLERNRGMPNFTTYYSGSPRDFANSLPEPVRQFALECLEKFGIIPYLGGIFSLKVCEVRGRFRIDEYDGFESVVQEDDVVWF